MAGCLEDLIVCPLLVMKMDWACLDCTCIYVSIGWKNQCLLDMSEVGEDFRRDVLFFAESNAHVR